MSYKVDNAIIMAAGKSTRFAPISYEKPKALIYVKGEVLIERQIKQLQEKGINNIIIVVGYKKEKFYYLKEKFGVEIVENKEYEIRNNHSSIFTVRDYLRNSYICSADNYFSINPFESVVEESYYAALYSEGKTSEWCLDVDVDGWIQNVFIGGEDCWYMMGHVFWSEDFSEQFLEILEREYDKEETKNKLWEAIYKENINDLKLKVRKYKETDIYEFDSLDELRKFDKSYVNESNSAILKDICNIFNCLESKLNKFEPYKDDRGNLIGFFFDFENKKYKFLFKNGKLERVEQK